MKQAYISHQDYLPFSSPILLLGLFWGFVSLIVSQAKIFHKLRFKWSYWLKNKLVN